MGVFVNRIIHGDCLEVLREIPDNYIHCIITSPPYATLKKYSGDSRDLGNYRLKDQVPFLVDISRELYRVLANNRRYCLNVMDIHESTPDGSYKLESLLWLLVPKVIDIGFVLKELIIWSKEGSFATPGSRGTVPFPPSVVLAPRYQYILVFQKPGKPDYSHITPEIKKRSEFLAKEEYGQWANCIWNFQEEKFYSKFHPAPFPEELPHRLITLYTFVDEIVLDPFCGTGTTCAVAKRFGRKYIGIDLKEEYCEIAEDRLKQVNLFDFDKKLGIIEKKRATGKKGKTLWD